MTREEAIKQLEQLKLFDCPLLLEAKRMAVSALREQLERRWIPVTERLPDKPMKCLVYTERGEYGGYEITYYNKGIFLQYSNVTHWMPLPEPPMEDVL